LRIACIAAAKVPSRTANSIEVMKVCHALRELGHVVRLWAPGRGVGPAWASLQEHYGLRQSFDVRWIPGASFLRRYDFSVLALAHARRWQADLYYVWPLQAAALAAQLGLPTVLEVHDRPTGRMGPALLRAFLRGRGARRMVVTTQALRAWLAAEYGAPFEAPFVIHGPNGVELERYRDLPKPDEARRMLGLPDRFTAGYTGHLYAGRGAELMAELARRNPQIQFLWAGGEPAAVEAWKSRLSAARIDNVTLLGFVPNERLPLVQAASDVLLMPYERRIAVSGGGDTSAFASPMKAFEYLAAGRAILSSDLPVIREVLNAANAVLLPAEDAAAWDVALKEVAADPAGRESLGAQARRDALQYTWEQRARRTLEGLEVERGD